MRMPIILLITFLLLPSALAQLSCSITTTAACTGVMVLKLSAATDAHAYAPTSATNTPNIICCSGVNGLTVSIPPAPLASGFFVGLPAALDDSHIAIASGIYPRGVYLQSATYDITCSSGLAVCGSPYTCLYGVNAAGNEDHHVFDCTSSRRTCCSATLKAAGFCTDSDGGADYAVKGTTTNSAGPVYDSCGGGATANVLTEYTCSGSTRNSQVYNCADMGGTCSDGRCVAAAGGCIDTDGGINYAIRGMAQVSAGNAVDSCLASNPDILQERYCNGGTWASVDYTCPDDSTCGILDNGRCSCVDTDGGANHGVQGSFFDAIGNGQDSCIEAQLREYTCDATTNRGVGTNVDCSAGTTCDTGACVAVAAPPVVPDTCIDTDEGPNDIFIPGTTTYNLDKAEDKCIPGEGGLIEYSCNAANQRESTYVNCLCAAGGGACVPSCAVQNVFWTDNNYENAIIEAVVNFPVSALITGQGCAGTTADFAITDGLNPIHEFESVNPVEFVQEGDIWYAAVSWKPTNPGSYKFGANLVGPSDTKPSQDSQSLTVTDSCSIPAAGQEECPADWAREPGDDLDCDDVQDCFDGWIGNAACANDPNTGVPVCQTGCEGTAWNCDNALFSECFPDPENQENFIQTRDISQCTKILGAYCPPPSDMKGCVMEEDFPVFSLMNILGVSIMLVGFYALKRK